MKVSDSRFKIFFSVSASFIIDQSGGNFHHFLWPDAMVVSTLLSHPGLYYYIIMCYKLKLL